MKKKPLLIVIGIAAALGVLIALTLGASIIGTIFVTVVFAWSTYLTIHDSRTWHKRHEEEDD